MLAGVALAVVLGTWLRMAVTWTDRDAAFLNDSAFHWRMIADGVPARDLRSEPPAGRDVRAYLPVGMYGVASAFGRALDGHEPRAGALLFVALAGGLIVLPVFAGARALGAGPWTSLAAGALAAFLPAHLHRTYAYFLRYDALGTLLLATHAAFAFRALGGSRRVWLESAASALALYAALACWRVALLFPWIEIGYVFVWFALRGAGPALRAWLTCQTAAVLLAALSLAYLRADHFLTSPTVFVLLFISLAIWIRFPRYPEGSISARGGILLGAVFLGSAVSRIFPSTSVVGEQLGIVPARLLQVFGTHVATTPMLDLQLTVEEMAAASPRALFGPAFLSWCALWFLASPLLAWLGAGRPGVRRLRQSGDGVVLLVFLCAGALFATLLFERDKVILAPLCALALGALVARWLARPSALHTTLAIALGICALVAGYDATQIAFSRRPDPDPDELAVLAYLQTHTPAEAIVLAPWEAGYEIQTFAARASVMDGLLESRENAARIESFARASFDTTADSMLALAHRYHASFLVVPPSSHLYSLGLVARVPFREKLVRGTPLEPGEAQGVMTRMMVLGRGYPGIEKVFEKGSWRVYAMRG